MRLAATGRAAAVGAIAKVIGNAKGIRPVAWATSEEPWLASIGSLERSV